jgi:hypothetical protein
LKAAALQEYAKYDAKGARELALTEMASSDPEIAVNGLLFLNDPELPQLTNAFRANLKAETFHWHLAAIERYGSGDLLPDVIKIYEQHKGTWACEIAERSLGFVVKHERARGLRLVEEANSYRTETGCYRVVLSRVLGNYPGPDVLDVALKHVDDSDEGVSTDAAFLANKQIGGPAKLKAIVASRPTRLSAKARAYIETQLFSPALLAVQREQRDSRNRWQCRRIPAFE